MTSLVERQVEGAEQARVGTIGDLANTDVA
jgi:hypothetical protein